MLKNIMIPFMKGGKILQPKKLLLQHLSCYFMAKTIVKSKVNSPPPTTTNANDKNQQMISTKYTKPQKMV